LRGIDGALLVWMTRLNPERINFAQVVKPEAIIRWHRASTRNRSWVIRVVTVSRAHRSTVPLRFTLHRIRDTHMNHSFAKAGTGFKAFWRWKSRLKARRPKIDRGLRDLIRRISREDPLWGAPRIHGELLMLGFAVAQSTVSKYIPRRRSPPSQSWKTFLRNHANTIAAIDMCVVPSLTFERLFVFLILGQGRRHLLWFEVTRHPTAEWLSRQLTEALPWVSAPTCLVRDNHGAYGHVFTRRLRAMGIRDRPISARSPWQNDYAERLIAQDVASVWITW